MTQFHISKFLFEIRMFYDSVKCRFHVKGFDVNFVHVQ